MKLGIAGTGMIVSQAMDALRDVPEIEITAIFARPQSVGKAEQLTAEYISAVRGRDGEFQEHRSAETGQGNIQIYMNYEEMLHSSEIECIYIGLTNSVHYRFTLQAIQAGKHVILEKPSVMRAEKLDELIAAAEEHHVILTEAFTTWHSPVFEKMREILPLIGRVRLAAGSYTQYSSRYNAYLEGRVLPAFDPEKGGGCLYDITIYGLSLLASLFGTPRKVEYKANRGFNGVDTSGLVLAEYPDFIASVSGAKDADGPGYFFVTGEKGWLRANGPLNVLQSVDYCVGGRTEHYEPLPDRHRMIREFRDFERFMRKEDGEFAENCLNWSRITIQMADAARVNAGLAVCGDL